MPLTTKGWSTAPNVAGREKPYKPDWGSNLFLLKLTGAVIYRLVDIDNLIEFTTHFYLYITDLL